MGKSSCREQIQLLVKFVFLKKADVSVVFFRDSDMTANTIEPLSITPEVRICDEEMRFPFVGGLFAH
jgi:hypothetical protein